VQHDAQENVLFHNVRWKTKACPIEPHIEVPIAIEVVRTMNTWRLPTA
jgi:hypothetical protein